MFFLGWIDGVWTPAGTIWVDPTTAFFTVVFVTTGNVTLQVPNDPYLAGTPLILQGCTVGSSPLTLSNPAGLVFRP